MDEFHTCYHEIINRQGKMMNSPEEKNKLCESILEGSNLNEEYYKLIMDALMRIPSSVLEEIPCSLDHVAVMRVGDKAGVETVRFTCMAKHDVYPEKDRIIIRRPNEPLKKPEPQVKPVYHQSKIIILVEDNMKKLPRAKKLATIAHEFAHVYLQDRFEGEQQEEEADKLIKSWGFSPVIPKSFYTSTKS